MFKEAKNSPSGNEIKKLFNLGQMTAKIHVITDEYKILVNRKGFESENLTDKSLSLVKPYINEDDFNFLMCSSKKCIDYIVNLLPTTRPYFGFCYVIYNQIIIVLQMKYQNYSISIAWEPDGIHLILRFFYGTCR